MTEGDISGASTPTRRLIALCLVVWLLLAVALPLAALTLNAVRIGAIPLGFWITSQGALFGLAVLVLLFARRAGGVHSGEGLKPALVFGGEVLGALAIAGAIGAIAALGYDGLPLALGIVAGLALMTILVAPRFVLYPVRSVGGYFSARFGGVWPRRIALIISGIAATFLLAADLRGGALAVQGLTGGSYQFGIAAIAVVIALAWLCHGLLAPRRIAGVAYMAVLVAVLIALGGWAANQAIFPLSYFSYGDALSSVAELDQQLVAGKLADVASLQPMASPFLKQSMANFAGLMLAVALGIAVAPHLIGRHISRAASEPGDAVRRAALATFFVAIVVAAAAPLAINARLAFAQVLAKGIETTVVPQAFADADRLSWINLCNRQTADPALHAETCQKMPGHRGFLRLQDVGGPVDGFIVAAPVIGALPAFVGWAFWFSLLVGSIVAGHAILGGVLGADGEARSTAQSGADKLDVRAGAVGAALIAIAAGLAATGKFDVASLAMDGLALAAAGLFPVVVLSLYWRRMSGTGAIAAMIAGFGIAAIYILGVRFFPLELVSLTGRLSDATANDARRLGALADAVQRVSDPAQLAITRALLEAQIGKMANWFGLKPASIVLIAVPAGAVAGIAVSLITGRRNSQA